MSDYPDGVIRGAMNGYAEAALKAVAQTLNEARFTNVRWQACERINEKLRRARIPLCLFDHGGIADVGHCEAGGT